MNPTVLLTVDVEDWFQVENFKQHIPFSSWPERELRVEKNTHRLLDLLDDYSPTRNSQPATRNPIKATFFVLGWIAERLPNLVREIHARGHEVASHGYFHELCSDQSCQALEGDLCDSKKFLEDIVGSQVHGYRAPSFSISDDILKTIQGCGYLYDSSYNSFSIHGRYGKVNLSNSCKKGIAFQVSANFFELPISNLELENIIDHKMSAISNFVLPWGGGGYFRLFPLFLFIKGVKWILKKNNAYIFYLHPWEIDPDQPKVSEASMVLKSRHYVNLATNYSKLFKFIDYFKQHHFITCSQYISELDN